MQRFPICILPPYMHCCCCLVTQLCLTLCNPIQHVRIPCPSPSPGACSNTCASSVMPSNHLVLCHPFSSCLQSFPASGSFPMSQLFTSGGQSIGASASASVLLVNIQVWPPCPPRDSQESSPTPQFKSISSSVFSFLYSPTLISTYDYWKNHSFD